MPTRSNLLSLNRLLNFGEEMNPATSTKAIRVSLSLRPWALLCNPAWRNADRQSIGASLPRPHRDRHRYSGQAQQVAGRHGELELQIDPSQAAKDGLPNPADSLCPAEVFFDTLAHHLAQSIAGMPGGEPIERTAAASGVVLSKMGSHTTFAASSHEVDGVERLVASQCAPTTRRH